MALARIKNKIAVRYNGVIVYHIHQDNLFENDVLEHYFTFNPFGTKEGTDTFSIDDIPEFNKDIGFAHNFINLIDKGVYGEPVFEEELDAFYSVTSNGIRAGYCPVCNAEISNYDSVIVHDDSLAYPFVCSNCEISGSEWSKTIFDGFTLK